MCAWKITNHQIMRNIDTKCLVLNADYTILKIVSWQKAIQWYFKYIDNQKYGIEIIDFYKNDYISGPNNKKFPIPAVVKAKTFFKLDNKVVTFSRKNIFLRDDYTCQYCGHKFDTNQLTYDHVIPKSIWNKASISPTNWLNIVTACISCNRKKGNKTPKQANMTLKNLPIKPNKNTKYLSVSHQLSKIRDTIPEEWVLYLPTSYI